VRRSAGGFDPARYSVAEVTEAVARAYVVTHHYSGTYPAAARRYGMFVATDDGPDLVGVAVFGIPASARVLTGVFPDLEPYVATPELSRLVLEGEDHTRTGGAGTALADRAPGNSESWFIARCFERLAADGVRGVVAFADPVPRRAAGRVIFPGHVGTIYQASNAVLTGRGTPRTVTVLPDGTTLSDRALQKVRRQERGHGYVERRLAGLGATGAPGADPARWLRDALEDVGAVRLRHPGCLRYAMITSRRDRRRVRIAGTALAYPKAAAS
jgi:hypothetical protein